MRRTSFLAAAAAVLVLSALAEKARKATPPLPAAQYPLHETHVEEKVTVAAEPGDTDATAPHTRLDYGHHGFLPMRVIITNDSDEPLDLDEARIRFISADNVIVPAATEEELQRRMFSQKSVAGTKIPMPSPIPSITIHHKPVDKQILADEDDFGFKSTTVAAHSTAAGYLYYDTREIDEPVLVHAMLEVRKAVFASSKKVLFPFNIPLKPTPETDKPAAAAQTLKGGKP